MNNLNGDYVTMTLVKPDFQKLMDAMDEMENTREDCCRNCFEVGGEVNRCEVCEVNRCRNCKPIHHQIEEFLIIYTILELGLGSAILESFFWVYHVDIAVCSGCYLHSCSRCSAISFIPVLRKWFCVNCVYRCKGCSRKMICDKKREKPMCKDCRKNG